MSKILIICSEAEINNDLNNLLSEVGYEIHTVYSEKECERKVKEISPDIAIIDTSDPDINVSNICRNLKLQNTTNDTQIILLTSSEASSQEVLVGADGYITKPFNENILIATVNAHLRIKKLLDILHTNNSELAKSLYQLNVLYSTSSQLAGTLDKTKLIDIMNTGLEKSLNFSLCIALVINDPEDASLIINSEYPITEKLEQALKLRAIIGYKNLFDNNKLPFELSIKNIKTKKNYKENDGLLDIDILAWDRLFAPIDTYDQFFGTVEIIRKTDFSGEDSTCFQTVVKQVSLPLESALFYEEIKKTNIKLAKLERLKSEFISIVSHELRTPITSIKNSLDMILCGKMGDISDVQNNFLGLAKRNVDRLSGIINDLLDLSKIEAGKMEFRFEPCNIIEPVQFVISSYENMANEKNIQLNLEAKNKEVKIYGDSGRIEQILSNLITNAIKFTDENGEIAIKIEEIDSDSLNKPFICDDNQELLSGKYVKVSVKDTGIGIKKEDIPKVFDKFQQIESSLSRKTGGTGLGLPIARQLIEAHRGKIWLESEPQQGSEFSFIIPLLTSENLFIFEVDNALQKAKRNYSGFSLLCLSPEDKEAEKLAEEITDGKSVLFNGIQYKSFYDKKCLNLILSNVGRKITEDLAENIKNYVSVNQDKIKIKTGFSVYPEDAITSEELIEIAQKNTFARL